MRNCEGAGNYLSSDTHTSYVQGHTYHGLEDVLHAFDQLLVDLDGQVADHLSVLCQVEVGQTVLVLPRRVVLHELLRQAQKTIRAREGERRQY